MIADPIDDQPPAWFRRAVSTPGEYVAADADDVRVEGRRWGDRGPGVVLVHGVAANGNWWDHIAPLLAEDYQVLAVDLSGHGRSGRRAAYDLPGWSRDVRALASAADLPEPWFAIGHSVGGWVSLGAATIRPSAVAATVLIDSTIRARSAEHEPRFAAHAYDPPRTTKTEAALLERFRVVPDDPFVLPYVREHIARHSTVRVGDTWRWRLDRRIFARADWRAEELLTATPRPVALVRAEAGLIDHVVLARTRELLGDGAPVVTIPASGHHVILDQPLSVLSAVRVLLATWTVSAAR